MQAKQLPGSSTWRLKLTMVLMFWFHSKLQPGYSQEIFQLPWEREIPLKESAKSVFLTSILSPDNSLPNRRCYPRDGKAMTINNLKILWKALHNTFRVLKTDLDLRPIYHQNDQSTMAHLHLGLLAYWVVNTIRYQLKGKAFTAVGVRLSAQ